MARLALAVGYTSRGNSRSEEPRLLYLGTSYAAAKATLAALPEGIGYGEAYRLDGGPNKRFHAPTAEAVPAEDPSDPTDPTDPTETPATDPTESTEAPAPEGLAKVIGGKKK
jgi:hypothetical protein